jgi:hypothetical protein
MEAQSEKKLRRTIRQARLNQWLLTAAVVLTFALVVYSLGVNVGLWHGRTRLVTIVCHDDVNGHPTCMSEPIKVSR